MAKVLVLLIAVLIAAEIVLKLNARNAPPAPTESGSSPAASRSAP